MTAATVSSIGLGFVSAWLVIVALHAFFEARLARFEPLGPELPEHHDDHGGHGHGDHDHGHDHGHDDHHQH